MEEIYNKLIKQIKNYFEKNNINKAVIGLSGGIDSSTSCKLVVDAIGRENVFGIIMPEKGVSNEENTKDAVEFCKSLGTKYHIVEINNFLKEFKNLEWKQNELAEINTKARIRAVILYNFANTYNALVIGTSNKTEILLGYFTKYGDGAVDIEVIGSLYKTEVKKLAKYLKLPEKIINKTPSAELYHGQTDEKELGVSYEVLDEILKKIENKQEVDEKNSLVKKIIKRIKDNEHKRNLPAIIDIS